MSVVGQAWPDRDRRADESRPRHLRVVDAQPPGAQWRRRWIRLGGAVVGALVVALLFLSVGMHAMLAQNQFALDRLNTRAAAQQAHYQQLRLQVDQLESPQRIIATAKGKLGMVQPGSVAFLAPTAATSATRSTPQSTPQSTRAAPASPASSAAPASLAAPASPASPQPSPIAPASAPPGWSALKPNLAAHP